VNDLAGGGFIVSQRNAVLVGGTGTGKTHLAIAIATNHRLKVFRRRMRRGLSMIGSMVRNHRPDK
jgi:DNA replication protein DnaC